MFYHWKYSAIINRKTFIGIKLIQIFNFLRLHSQFNCSTQSVTPFTVLFISLEMLSLKFVSLVWMCSSRDTSGEVVFSSINRPLQVFTLKETVGVILSDPPCQDVNIRFKMNLIKNVEESVVFLTRKVFKVNSLKKQI